MTGRKIQLGLLLAVAGVLIVVGIVGTANRAEGTPDVVIQTRYGGVKWNHELHARLPDFNCQVCHHDAKTGTTNPAGCNECHKKPGEKPPEGQEKATTAMKAYHAKCIGCHQAVEKGPVTCAECHDRAEQAGGGAKGFQTPYGAVAFDHDRHTGYGDCFDCHHEAKEGGEFGVCGDCHKHPGEKSNGPSGMLAYHKNCIECHVAAQKGPAGCRECHAKPAAMAEPDVKKLTADDGPETSILDHLVDTYPPYEFNHKEHAEDFTDGCADCHHEVSDVEVVASCRACHNTKKESEDGIPGLMDAYHKQCRDCHKEADSGPTKCQECHPKKRDKAKKFESSNVPGESNLNHLSAVYKPVAFTHEDHIDYTDSCEDCHHKGSEVEKYPACRECHNTPFKADGKKLGLVDAYHKQCIDCHIEQDSGPTACADCHEKK
jgi:hypothetical protein